MDVFGRPFIQCRPFHLSMDIIGLNCVMRETVTANDIKIEINQAANQEPAVRLILVTYKRDLE